MSQNSLLDTLFSLFGALRKIGPTLPGVLFNIGVVLLSLLGWQKHRASGFLLVLTAGAIGLTSSLLWLSFITAGSHVSDFHSPIIAAVSALGSTSMIFWIAGLWCLVYRTRFAPPEDSDQSPP
ncbi:MAG: hypothetical protein K8R23_14010 [Chthoniobacter sp.]|nr:hypothetical protein [Chthoniobacter sp.]